MFSKKSFYITTTLPYVNADPHIGFAYEIVVADVVARYKESNGYKVFFNTGTDEHGLKIYSKALEESKDTQKYVDEYAEKFKNLKEILNLYPNINFIRTTDPKHVAAAKLLWKICTEKGFIDKKKYKGLYCVGDETFVREAELINGRCPNHLNTELIEIEEENYFFNLNKCKPKLRELLSNKKNLIIPNKRRNEAITILDHMDDFSISRERSRLPWGIPVPGDETQVMYVWFDALISYISTLDWPKTPGNYEIFWKKGHSLQLAGKDQVKFQSVIWQAMLIAAELKPTDQIFYHGFINSDGQKMSKSLGNVISPYELVKKYGTEATRYLLIKHVNPFEDTDITWAWLDEWYRVHLSNGLGNLTSRVMKMAEHLDGPVKIPKKATLIKKRGENGWIELLEKFRPDQSLDQIWLQGVEKVDKFIQTTKPFETIKTNPEKARKDITKSIMWLYEIAIVLKIFMPETSEKILKAIKDNKKPDNLFPRLNA